MDDIAEEIQATKGTLYYYFRSKEEVFAEIRMFALRRALERLRKIRGIGAAPAETLELIVEDLLTHGFLEVGHYAVTLNDPHALGPDQRSRVRELEREYEQKVIEVIEAGIVSGELAAGDAKLAAFTLLRTTGSVQFWYREGGRLGPAYIVREVARQVMTGVRSNVPWNSGPSGNIQSAV